MKKLFLHITFFSVLNLFSQSSTTPKDYFRFDIGYEQNGFMAHNGWNTKAGVVEFELPLAHSAWAANYRISIGQTNDAHFYMHMPFGPVVGLLAAGIGSKFGCNNLALDAILFLIPDGFAYFPLQTDQVHFGVYANFISFDFAGGPRGGFDYAPDTGIKLHFFIGEKTFLFLRASGKYSTKFSGWGAQAAIGIGWDFDRK